MTVDAIFPKKKRKDDTDGLNARPPLAVAGYTNDENMWDFVTQIGFAKTMISSSCKTIKIVEPTENADSKCRDIH